MVAGCCSRSILLSCLDRRHVCDQVWEFCATDRSFFSLFPSEKEGKKTAMRKLGEFAVDVDRLAPPVLLRRCFSDLQRIVKGFRFSLRLSVASPVFCNVSARFRALSVWICLHERGAASFKMHQAQQTLRTHTGQEEPNDPGGQLAGGQDEPT